MFHTKYMMWFQRHEEPKTITDAVRAGEGLLRAPGRPSPSLGPSLVARPARPPSSPPWPAPGQPRQAPASEVPSPRSLPAPAQPWLLPRFQLGVGMRCLPPKIRAHATLPKPSRAGAYTWKERCLHVLISNENLHFTEPDHLGLNPALAGGDWTVHVNMCLRLLICKSVGDRDLPLHSCCED